MSNEQCIGLALVLLGVAALFWYLAWRWSYGADRHSGTGNGTAGADHGASNSGRAVRRKAAKVDIFADDCVDLDGERSDLATTIARLQEVGAAEVYVASDAREGWVNYVLHALRLLRGVDLRIHDPLAHARCRNADSSTQLRRGKR